MLNADPRERFTAAKVLDTFKKLISDVPDEVKHTIPPPPQWQSWEKYDYWKDVPLDFAEKFKTITITKVRTIYYDEIEIYTDNDDTVQSIYARWEDSVDTPEKNTTPAPSPPGSPLIAPGSQWHFKDINTTYR